MQPLPTGGKLLSHQALPPCIVQLTFSTVILGAIQLRPKNFFLKHEVIKSVDTLSLFLITRIDAEQSSQLDFE